ncbi:type II toxin-antitoxin system HicB family antitoxin [Duganella fentianensis]|uniref:type II toxin-antitoxin system HicB family antitoxin n=1 Tax=Duganella fentianensis TaxID=2692177 RepID=UPI0032B2BC6C
MFDYPVTLTPDDGSVLVTFADVPEAITFGINEKHALSKAVDALETALSFYVDAGKPLPQASQAAAGQKTVRPSALELTRLVTYQAQTEQGVD